MKYTPSKPGRGYLANLLQVLLLVAAPATYLFGEIPKSVPVYDFVPVTLNPDETALVVRDGLLPVKVIETKDGIAFTGPPGRYLVALITPGKATPEQHFVEIVGVVPPPPIDPPKPPVDPPIDPPKPDGLDKAPLPGLAGLKVLLIYETADLPPKVPAEQYNIKVDPKVTSWLTAKTTPENGWAGWRWGDPDSGVAQGAMHWEKMLSLPRTSTPWVVINNGTRNVGYSGPLPATSGEFLKLVEKYQ